MESEGGLALATRPPPRPVAEAVHDALDARDPRGRYLVATPGDRAEILGQFRSWTDQLGSDPAFYVAGE